MRRLIYDIETSMGAALVHSIGRKVSINHQDLIIHPSIICICYKWENEKTVHSLQWDDGDDAQMIRDFIRVIDGADEMIAHNGDNFDIKYIFGRAIFHRIPMDNPKEIRKVDTLKWARQSRNMSNRLDHLLRYYGVGQKYETSKGLWHDVSNPIAFPHIYPKDSKYEKALAQMVKYCKEDCRGLQKVWEILRPYSPASSHVGVQGGGERYTCPHCGGDDVIKKEWVYSAKGIKSARMRCKPCGRKYNITLGLYYKWRDHASV